MRPEKRRAGRRIRRQRRIIKKTHLAIQDIGKHLSRIGVAADDAAWFLSGMGKS